MRSTRSPFQWPIAVVITAAALALQTPGLSASPTCHCHILPWFEAGGGDWWYISAVVNSGGDDPCSGDPADIDMNVRYVRGPSCHTLFLPYPICGPGNATPCEHCPQPGAACFQTSSKAAGESPDAAPGTALTDFDLPKSQSDATEGNLTLAKLQQVGSARVRYLKIVSEGQLPRWAKLSALTAKRDGANRIAPFTVRVGFEINGPVAPATEVRIEELPLQDVGEYGPTPVDGWEARVWETTEDGKKVSYIIRFAK